MSTAKAEITVEAPIETAFEVISDFESYPEFLSETKEVEILKQSTKSVQALFTVSLIKKIKYSLEMKFNKPKSLTWKLIKGDLMKKNQGSWKLTEKNGLTTLAYEIDMEFTTLVPKAISNKLVGSSLPSMLKSFRDRIEEMV